MEKNMMWSVSRMSLGGIIIIIIENGWQCKAGIELFTPYQSTDPSPKIMTNRKKEDKPVEDKKRASNVGQ